MGLSVYQQNWENLLIVTPTGTCIGSKRLSIQDFTLKISTGIVESKFPKLGNPQSNETTANQ